MDKETRNLMSKKVTTDISRNLVRNLGGKYMSEAPDKITDQNWVALSTMLVHVRRDFTTLIDTVLANTEGGLAYMAMLTVIHDKLLDCANSIEDTLNIKTSWFPETRIDRGKTGDKAGDYFYTKLRKEVEDYLDERRKEKGDEAGGLS